MDDSTYRPDKRDREFIKSMFEKPDDKVLPNPINWVRFCAEYLLGFLLLCVLVVGILWIVKQLI